MGLYVNREYGIRRDRRTVWDLVGVAYRQTIENETQVPEESAFADVEESPIMLEPVPREPKESKTVITPEMIERSIAVLRMIRKYHAENRLAGNRHP